VVRVDWQARTAALGAGTRTREEQLEAHQDVQTDVLAPTAQLIKKGGAGDTREGETRHNRAAKEGDSEPTPAASSLRPVPFDFATTKTRGRKKEKRRNNPKKRQFFEKKRRNTKGRKTRWKKVRWFRRNIFAVIMGNTRLIVFWMEYSLVVGKGDPAGPGR
jgi:hypothetical protein